MKKYKLQYKIEYYHKKQVWESMRTLKFTDLELKGNTDVEELKEFDKLKDLNRCLQTMRAGEFASFEISNSKVLVKTLDIVYFDDESGKYYFNEEIKDWKSILYTLIRNDYYNLDNEYTQIFMYSPKYTIGNFINQKRYNILKNEYKLELNVKVDDETTINFEKKFYSLDELKTWVIDNAKNKTKINKVLDFKDVELRYMYSDHKIYQIVSTLKYGTLVDFYSQEYEENFKDLTYEVLDTINFEVGK